MGSCNGEWTYPQLANGNSDDTEESKPIPCSSLHKTYDFQLLLKLREVALDKTYVARRLGSLYPRTPWATTELARGKCTAVVRFKVNRPINLESFGFFGPHDEGSRGKYHTEISLLTEDYFEIGQSTQITPVIKTGEIFHVKFDQCIPLLPCMWYMAKFSLLGPPTSQSLKIYSTASVNCGDFGNCRFKFEMPDSNQMPEIGFTIRP